MPPLDFPSSNLTIGQLYAGPNNVQWQWDGSKWLGTPNTLGPIIVAASPPTFVSGQLWWDSTGGNLYLGYDDGNTQQWVPASNIAGLANAATTMDVDKALGNVGRNLIHNSAFTIAQRGAGPWSSGYTVDRWMTSTSTSTATVTQIALTDTDRAQIGDEAATFALQSNCTGTAGAGDFVIATEQRLEDLRRFGGKTVTLSFYAKATAGTPKLGFEFEHQFGNGGSPSAPVVGIGAQSFTLSTTWARYAATVVLPTLAGKTLGTGPILPFLMLRVWQSAGSTYNAQGGSIGVQSYVLQLWGVQLEIVQPGQTVPTKLEKRDPVLELQQCQRFFQVGQFQFGSNQSAGNTMFASMLPPVTLRSTSVTFAITAGTNQNCGVTSLTYNGYAISATALVTATAPTVINSVYTVSADL